MGSSTTSKASPAGSLRRSSIALVVVMSLLATAHPAIARQSGSGTNSEGTIALDPPSALKASIDRAAAELSQSATLEPAAPRKNWAQRHPLLTGTLIGIAGGAIVDIAACNANCGFYTLGAALGSFGGILASAKPRPSFTFAGSLTPADTTEIHRVVRALGIDEKIELADSQGRIVRGKIVAFDDQQLVVEQKASMPSLTVRYDDLRSIRKQRMGPASALGLVVGSVAILAVIGAASQY